VDINGGKSSTKVYVTPLNDAIAEGIENIVVSLSAGPGYTVASASSATVTIADSTQTAGPVVVGVVASDPIASELGSEPGTFTFFRMGGSDRPLALRYTISGTASNGGDYTSLSGSVNFGRRKTSATVSVRPIVDATREGAENVVLALAPSPNYTIGSFGIATVSILDNPNPVLGAAGSQGPTLTVPVLTAAGQGNGELAISWDCLAGQRYQLQYRSGWNATPWTDLGGVIITPEDATVIIPDLIGAEAQRSYRVVLLPLDAQ
jgi:hypothetical protein